MDVRATATTGEIRHAQERVALHVRSYGSQTNPVVAPEHRPRSHREYGDWPPERFISWGRTIGPHVGGLIESMFGSERHPELRYRSALGVIRLAKSYGAERADAACRRALEIKSPSYRSVQTILKHGLDRIALPLDSEEPQSAAQGAPAHEHVRGAEYFDKEEME